jgi:hypothetical protein
LVLQYAYGHNVCCSLAGADLAAQVSAAMTAAAAAVSASLTATNVSDLATRAANLYAFAKAYPTR